MHGGGGRCRSLASFFFHLIVFHQQCVENVVSNCLYRHLQNFVTRVPALTEVAVRWDVRDGAITCPAACPPYCWFFSQALPRRQSLTSILTAVLCLVLLWWPKESVKENLLVMPPEPMTSFSVTFSFSSVSHSFLSQEKKNGWVVLGEVVVFSGAPPIPF